mgnify:FL=1
MANKISFVFDAEKLKRDLKKASGEEAEAAVKKITKAEKLDIGEAVIDEMQVVIAKGISPIKENGRFPAYKWADKKQLARKSGSKKKEADRFFKNKYPYSAQAKFPGKKERPVNLKLSGDFLKNLKAKVLNTTLWIGFFEEPWTLYEQGHREGVGGQPKRPIIPNGDEELSQTIYRRLVKSLQQVFDRKK